MVNVLLEKALLGMFAPFFGAKFLPAYRHCCSSISYCIVLKASYQMLTSLLIYNNYVCYS